MTDPPALSTVFDHFGVDYREHKNEQVIRCFAHEETRPSCSVNLEKGVFSCFACLAQGGTLEAIRLLAGLETLRDAATYAESEGLAGTSDEPVRGKHRERPSIPGGSRFRPKYRAVPPWRRASG